MNLIKILVFCYFISFLSEVVLSRQDAFTLDVLEVPQGSGSGFVWDTKGHIVTNYHVIRGASDLRLVMLFFFTHLMSWNMRVNIVLSLKTNYE